MIHDIIISLLITLYSKENIGIEPNGILNTILNGLPNSVTPNGVTPNGVTLKGVPPNGVLPNVYLNTNKRILSFYRGAPKHGIYIRYLEKISKYVLNHVRKKEITELKNKAIILDFDDTIVWTKPYCPISPIHVKSPDFGNVFYYQPLYPIVKLVRELKKMGFWIFIITSRPPNNILSVMYNLRKYGIPWDSIFTSSFVGEHLIFKSKIRKIIESHIPEDICGLNTFQLMTKSKPKKNGEKTNIVVSIGDNWYDIYEGNGDIGIKLPSPGDLNAYVYYNNRVISFI